MWFCLFVSLNKIKAALFWKGVLSENHYQCLTGKDSTYDLICSSDETNTFLMSRHSGFMVRIFLKSFYLNVSCVWTWSDDDNVAPSGGGTTKSFRYIKKSLLYKYCTFFTSHIKYMHTQTHKLKQDLKIYIFLH